MSARNLWPSPTGQSNAQLYEFSRRVSTLLKLGVYETSAADGKVYNVMRFGAANNGTSSSVAAIRAAVAEASATGGVIHFPAGDGYVIDEPITINFGKVALTGDALGRASYLIVPDNVNAFVFSADDPENDTLGDIGLHNLTIWGPTGPTAGIGIKFVRCNRVYMCGLDLRAFYKGVQIEGGNEIFMSDATLGGAVWAGASSGSFLLKLMKAAYGATNEAPSEVFVSNFNFKGTPVGPYLENGIVLEACDGLFMSNGHAGFTSNAGLLIKATGSDTSIVNIDVANVMFDGNAGDGGYGIRTSGTSGGVIRELTFDSVKCVGHAENGIELGLADLKVVNITGGKFSSNGKWGVKITAGDDITIAANKFYDNNAGAGSEGDISIDGVTDVLVDGNKFKAGGTAQTYGVLVGSGSNDQVQILNNSFKGCTTDIQINSVIDDLVLENNTTDKADTIASASTITIPNVGNTFHITGTTDISDVSMPYVPGREIKLVFADVLNVSSGTVLLMNGRMRTVSGAVLTLVNDGTVVREVARSPLISKSAVASMPAAGVAGHKWFATDGRKVGEGAGSGTGVECYDDGTAWRTVDASTTVAA